MKALRKQVMISAWRLFRSGVSSFAAALRQAWREVKFQAVMALLRSGVATVTFRKCDGTITTRTATRNFDLLPACAHPKGDARWERTWDVVPFYSIGDEGWRSFRLDNLISFHAA